MFCHRAVFLLNRLLAASILVDEIEEGDGIVSFSVDFTQSGEVEGILGEYGMRYRRKGYTGARSFCKKILSRPFLLAALMIAIIGIVFFENFIFSYSIKGNARVNTALIENVLRERGASGFVAKSSLDVKAIKSAISDIEGISFASVKIEGNRLLVEVKEELPIVTPDEPRYDPVSSLYSAVVTKVVAESGTPTVSSGDRVVVGDLLISPTYTFTEGEAPSPARGEVWGLVTYKKEVILPLYTAESIETGEVFRARTLTLFGQVVGKAEEPPFDDYLLEERVIYRGIGVVVRERTYRRLVSETICHDFDLEAPIRVSEAQRELLLSVPFYARERSVAYVVQKKLDNVLYIVIYYTVEQRIDSQFVA